MRRMSFAAPVRVHHSRQTRNVIEENKQSHPYVYKIKIRDIQTRPSALAYLRLVEATAYLGCPRRHQISSFVEGYCLMSGSPEHSQNSKLARNPRSLAHPRHTLEQGDHSTVACE
ncbi:hypothetical protein ElyMa_005536400 [Elysia marginata]|uniref:Uncharacterized protein n=1 Tax=Elysia marginata TaxID=1093978 RepID=A0AAV4EX43_9GAST|nr:hypothetical protein ElyMa_005536400 [Elysia marginata]